MLNNNNNTRLPVGCFWKFLDASGELSSRCFRRTVGLCLLLLLIRSTSSMDLPGCIVVVDKCCGRQIVVAGIIHENILECKVGHAQLHHEQFESSAKPLHLSRHVVVSVTFAVVVVVHIFVKDLFRSGKFIQRLE